MGGAFGEDRDGAAAGEHAPSGLESLAVLRRVRACILAAVHGNRLKGAAQPADDGHPEQRSLGEEGDATRGETEEETGIDEAVGVIQDEQHGASRRNVLGAGDLDAAKEDPED